MVEHVHRDARPWLARSGVTAPRASAKGSAFALFSFGTSMLPSDSNGRGYLWSALVRGPAVAFPRLAEAVGVEAEHAGPFVAYRTPWP